MFCPNCGTQVPDDAVTCDSCGTRLAAGETIPASPPPAAPTPPPYPAYAGPAVETSGLAIVSMVLGLVSILAGGGMLLVPGILALVLGYMARNQIRESGGTIKGDELALVGMVTGGISVVLGLLICVLFGGIFGLSFCLPLCFVPLAVIDSEGSSRY